jgi:hypothetical protein
MDAAKSSSAFHFQNPLKFQSNLCIAIISIQKKKKKKGRKIFPEIKKPWSIPIDTRESLPHAQ